jgi:hypothetical protein
MIIRVPVLLSDAILGAMLAVALAHGDGIVTDADRRTIAAAAAIVFGRHSAEGADCDDDAAPVLFSWHLGIRLNDIAGASIGAFAPRKFWTAWERGTAATVDVVPADWGFWDAAPVPLDELRRRYGIPAVADELLA